MSRKPQFSLAESWNIHVTPHSRMVTDGFIAAPRSMWSPRSSRARAVFEFADAHPTVGVLWREWHGARINRPSLLRKTLAEFDGWQYGSEPQGIRATASDGLARYYVLDDGTGVNAEWADIFMAHGLVPFTIHPLKAVRWCDARGNRVGYQMPVRRMTYDEGDIEDEADIEAAR